MRSLARPDDTDDEETSLLRAQGNDALHEPTPLPIGQIAILVLPWIAETIVYHSISPYVNQVGRWTVILHYFRHIGVDQC